MNSRAVINVVSALSGVIGLTILSAVPIAFLMGDSNRDCQLMFLAAIIPVLSGAAGYI